MFKIEDAPKDKIILLRVPAFSAFTEQWWIGHWSCSNEAWAIRTPWIHGHKLVIEINFPTPTGWAELPET